MQKTAHVVLVADVVRHIDNTTKQQHIDTDVQQRLADNFALDVARRQQSRERYMQSLQTQLFTH